MILYYAPDIETSPILPEEESQHCVRVLRHTRGDEIIVTDGRGYFYTCVITNPSQHRCEVEIQSKQQQPINHHSHIHLAIAPTKNIDRLEWMLEKCVEIGIDEITPILCRYSERKTINYDRLQKIVISAAKQSLKAQFPVLHPLTPIEDIIHLPKSQNLSAFIAYCNDADRHDLKDELLRLAIPSATAQPAADSVDMEQMPSILVLIGPEGDFSEREIQDALQNGFCPVSLGNSRLRTETAGLVATHMAVLLLG